MSAQTEKGGRGEEVNQERTALILLREEQGKLTPWEEEQGRKRRRLQEK